LKEECSIRDAVTDVLHSEASELIAIFITMVNRTKAKNKSPGS